MNESKVFTQLTIASLYIYALFSFASISLMSLHHILLFFPAIYFSIKYFKEKTFYLSKSHLWLILFVFFLFISIVVNAQNIETPVKTIFKLKYFIIPYLGVFAISHLIKTNRITNIKMNKLVKIMFIMSAVVSGIGLLSYILDFNIVKMHAELISRASGTYGMVMTYAYQLSCLLSAILYLIINSKNIISIKYKIFLITIFIINFAGLYFSYTRGAMISFIISLPFMFFFTNKKIFISLLIPISAFILFIAISILQNKSINFYRFNKLLSNSQRMSMFNLATKSISDKYITGLGYRNFENECPSLKIKYKIKHTLQNKKVSDFCGHAHNNYLEIFADGGLFSFVSFLLFLFYWLKELIESRTIISRAIFILLINFIVSGLFQSTIIDGEITFFIMGVFMISTALTSQKEIS